MRSVFAYNGYEYCPWDDVEEDNIKTFHECYKDGKRIKMPGDFYNHSPYSLMPYEEFCKHVQSLEVFIQG
jgi:predicted nucleotidyltransferase